MLMKNVQCTKKSDNKELMTYHNANNIVYELFNTLLSRYSLEKRMERSESVFDSAQLLY